MTPLERLSFAIDWPTVGWIGVGVVLTLAVVWAAYEITGEVQRKRRIRARLAALRRHGPEGQQPGSR